MNQSQNPNRRNAVFLLIILVLVIGGIVADIAKLEILHVSAVVLAIAFGVYLTIRLLREGERQ